MRKRKLFFVLLWALLPFIGWAQQRNYDAQHISIKQTNGDSIQYDISTSYGGFKPVIRNGKVEWSFQRWSWEEGTTEAFAVKDVESIDFRSFEYDETESRKALIEFYQAMDGDNWPESAKENWCSDKPIWEWRGVNEMSYNRKPWVNELNGSWYDANNKSKKACQIPECISRMGPIQELRLNYNNFTGGIPDFIGNNRSLRILELGSCGLTGPFPKSFNNLAQNPGIWEVYLGDNNFEGPLPEEMIVGFMDREIKNNNYILELRNNHFSGKVPDAIKNHPKFCITWPHLIIQKGGGMDLSDLTIPAPVFTFKDVDGNTIDLAETYEKNKYTLLYVWGWWCSWSELYNQQLIPAYQKYKDKGLEIIGLHRAADEEEDAKLKDYLASHSITWKNSFFFDWAYEDKGAGTAFDTSLFTFSLGTPQVFLVDQNGNIVFNSYMDEEGNDQEGTLYRNELFTYLEDRLGKVDYDYYTSTDYSHDGEVSTLQTATIGQGVDLVFVGEGFTDKDIAEGKFDKSMNDAAEQFFAYEPYKSLRNRFNVYAVKTVSPNAEFVEGCTHAIDEVSAKALEYASKVPSLIPNRPMHVNVIYNKMSGKRSYCMMFEDNSYICYAMGGITTILNHEAGGHGLGKLMDEYVENEKEGDWTSLPDDQKQEMENAWMTLGWGANVDWRSNPTEVKWAKFINDPRYADEKIGVYEGSYLYSYGAYRPTENSMMRHNDVGFNAPSREEIYKRVMKESEGDSWTYDYETFVAFDATGRAEFVNALSSSAKVRKVSNQEEQTTYQRTAPPVFLEGTWRDYLKK